MAKPQGMTLRLFCLTAAREQKSPENGASVILRCSVTHFIWDRKPFTMKILNNIEVVAIAAVMMFMISCDTMDNMDDGEEFELRAVIDVVVSNGHFNHFVGEDSMDALIQSELIQIWSGHIKSIEITEVKYLVSTYSGSPTQQITSATLEVANPDGSEGMVLSSLQNINLMQAFLNESPLVVDPAAADKLADLIKEEPHQAMIYLRGDCNEVPSFFTILVKFTVKMVTEVD